MSLEAARQLVKRGENARFDTPLRTRYISRGGGGLVLDAPLEVGVGFRLAVVGLMVAANAFFVAAEFALVTIRRARVEQLVAEGHPAAGSLRRATTDPTIFVVATQLGVTMATLALGWIGEPTLAGLIEPLFRSLPTTLASAAAHSVAIAVSFAIITGLHVVLGELVPRSVALQHAERASLFAARPMVLFATLLRPVIWLFDGASHSALSLLGVRPALGLGLGLVHSTEELKVILGTSRQAGVVDARLAEVASNVLDFDELRAHQMMTPRTEMVCVRLSAKPDEALRLMIEAGHSQLPVYQGDLDNVVGVVHLKSLVQCLHRDTQRTPHLRQIMREPLMLPDSLPALDLLTALRERKTHLAILVDEYGGTAGLVTVHDVFDRAVGEVKDEFTSSRVDVQLLPDGALIDGLVTLEEVNDALGLALQDDDYDTLGGLVLGRLGRMAQGGDEVEVEGVRLRVEAMDGRRIALVRATVERSDPAGGEADTLLGPAGADRALN